MAHPKRQHSRQRSAKRRTHWKLTTASLSKCSNCNASIQPHRVCSECGYYKGRQIFEIVGKKTAA